MTLDDFDKKVLTESPWLTHYQQSIHFIDSGNNEKAIAKLEEQLLESVHSESGFGRSFVRYLILSQNMGWLAKSHQFFKDLNKQQNYYWVKAAHLYMKLIYDLSVNNTAFDIYSSKNFNNEENKMVYWLYHLNNSYSKENKIKIMRPLKSISLSTEDLFKISNSKYIINTNLPELKNILQTQNGDIDFFDNTSYYLDEYYNITQDAISDIRNLRESYPDSLFLAITHSFISFYDTESGYYKAIKILDEFKLSEHSNLLIKFIIKHHVNILNDTKNKEYLDYSLIEGAPPAVVKPRSAPFCELGEDKKPNLSPNIPVHEVWGTKIPAAPRGHDLFGKFNEFESISYLNLQKLLTPPFDSRGLIIPPTDSEQKKKECKNRIEKNVDKFKNAYFYYTTGAGTLCVRLENKLGTICGAGISSLIYESARYCDAQGKASLKSQCGL